MNAETRGEIDQRIANVVASVADVGQLEAAQRAEFFLESEEIARAWQG